MNDFEKNMYQEIHMLREKFSILKLENAKLKNQLRWRPVSEKPERWGEYLCTWDFSDSVVMYYDDYNSGWSVWDASWDDYIDAANPPKYWLPIPPAPEEKV